MITNGEQEIDKVLAILPDGKTGAPCGACRELMVQLMPDSYKDIEIMLDYEKEKIIKLGEITPEWVDIKKDRMVQWNATYRPGSFENETGIF